MVYPTNGGRATVGAGTGRKSLKRDPQPMPSPPKMNQRTSAAQERSNVQRDRPGEFFVYTLAFCQRVIRSKIPPETGSRAQVTPARNCH